LLSEIVISKSLGAVFPVFLCSCPLGLLIFLVIFVFEILRARRDRKAEQIEADRYAEQARVENERIKQEAIADRDGAAFALYLRPFAVDKVIRKRAQELSWLPHVLIMQLIFPDRVNFDYELNEDFKSLLGIQLISLDAENENQGAGHFQTTDSAWVQEFRLLAVRAKTIVIVPGVSSGIMDEIRWLTMTGLLSNAVFFKPRGYPKSLWQATKEEYEREGVIELPNYSPHRLSFRINTEGNCYDVHDWKVRRRGSEKLGRAQRRRLLTNRPLDGSNDIGLAPLPDFPTGAKGEVLRPPVVAFSQFLMLFLASFPAVGLLLVFLFWDSVPESVPSLSIALMILAGLAGAVSVPLVAFWGLLKRRRYGRWVAIGVLFAPWGLYALITLVMLLLVIGGTEPIDGGFFVVMAFLVPLQALFLVPIIRLLFAKQVREFFRNAQAKDTSQATIHTSEKGSLR
jgi:hypothetical protein